MAAKQSQQDVAKTPELEVLLSDVILEDRLVLEHPRVKRTLQNMEIHHQAQMQKIGAPPLALGLGIASLK